MAFKVEKDIVGVMEDFSSYLKRGLADGADRFQILKKLVEEQQTDISKFNVVKIITEGAMDVDFEGLQKAYADKDVVIFADCSGERPKIISSGIIHPIPSEPRPKWIIKGLL